MGARTCRRLAAAILLAISVAACGGEERSSVAAPEPGPLHVHGLGVNPSDGALFVATHTGLYRAGRGEERLRRVGDSRRDTMGFRVTGPDTFLGSGHPNPRSAGPPHLGLIVSVDAGRSWRPLAHEGRADFHVLRSGEQAIYGFDGLSGRLLASPDAGRSWQAHGVPGPFVDLVLEPREERHLVASTDAGLHRSRDGGRRWREIAGREPGLLAWPERAALYRLAADGTISRSRDGGRTWRTVGSTSGRAAAFTATQEVLYVALDNGQIEHSTDGGRTWRLRARP